MDFSKSGSMSAMTNFLNTVGDRIFGAETVPVVENKNANLARKQANIRAVSVREGFQAILARNNEMAQRIEQYKQQRNRTAEAAAAASIDAASIDVVETSETIVLSSN